MDQSLHDMIVGHVGGQLGVVDGVNEWYQCGEIKTIKIDRGNLVVHFAWRAKAVDENGRSVAAGKLVKAEGLMYQFPLETPTIQITPARLGHRLVISDTANGTSVIFAPPGDVLAERSEVEGL